jgi:membrane-associated phospholipid phosphatase
MPKGSGSWDVPATGPRLGRQRGPQPPQAAVLQPIEILAFALNLFFAVCSLANVGKVQLRLPGFSVDRELVMGLVFLALSPLMLLLVRLLNPRPELAARFFRLCYLQAFYLLYFGESIRLSQLWYGGASLDAFFAGLDGALFGLQPAIEFSRRLQSLRWVNELFFFSYFFFYILVATGVWALFFRRRFREAERFLFTVSASFFVMYVWFAFFPVKGPKYFFPELRAVWYDNFRGYLFTGLMKGAFSRLNLAGAAFPSSHVAVALVALVLNWKHNRFLVPLYLPFTLLLCASTVYLYAHYFVDVPAGLLTGLALYFLAPRLRPAAERAAGSAGRFLAARIGFPAMVGAVAGARADTADTRSSCIRPASVLSRKNRGRGRASTQGVTMSVSIREVTGGRDLARFIRFPFRLYRGNRYWVPPLLMDERNTLNPGKNPAYEHCRVRLLLAEEGGRLLGRVAAIINEKYIQKWGNKYCRFGWLDFVDDPRVSAALLGAVESWARENGLEAVHGPLGFTDLDREGMLIEGFEELGTSATHYNHPYYPRHLEALGYAKDVDWIEFFVSAPKEIPEKVLRIQELVLKRSGLRLVEPKLKTLISYAQKIFAMINEAYADLYGVVELTPAQVDMYVKQYFSFLNPDYAKVVVDAEDQVVAFGLAIPSLSRALQRCRGRLLPFGFLHLLWALKRPRVIDMLLVAVKPELQARGLPAILMTEITRNSLRHGVRGAETNPELESNTQVQAIWKHYEARRHKRRRCYLKRLS